MQAQGTKTRQANAIERPFCGELFETAQPGWLADFVNGPGQTAGKRNPNAAIRIKLR